MFFKGKKRKYIGWGHFSDFSKSAVLWQDFHNSEKCPPFAVLGHIAQPQLVKNHKPGIECEYYIRQTASQEQSYCPTLKDLPSLQEIQKLGQTWEQAATKLYQAQAKLSSIQLDQIQGLSWVGLV